MLKDNNLHNKDLLKCLLNLNKFKSPLNNKWNQIQLLNNNKIRTNSHKINRTNKISNSSNKSLPKISKKNLNLLFSNRMSTEDIMSSSMIYILCSKIGSWKRELLVKGTLKLSILLREVKENYSPSIWLILRMMKLPALSSEKPPINFTIKSNQILYMNLVEGMFNWTLNHNTRKFFHFYF